jgi:hypothetical protein
MTVGLLMLWESFLSASLASQLERHPASSARWVVKQRWQFIVTLPFSRAEVCQRIRSFEMKDQRSQGGPAIKTA